MNCSSQSPHPAKRACVDVEAASVHVLKEEDPVDISPHVPAEVSNLDPPPAPVKRLPPARYVASDAAADLMSNDTGGVDEEHQDDKDAEIGRRDGRDKADGIAEEANDGLQNAYENNDSHLEAPSQKRKRNSTPKSFEERIDTLKAFKAKHGHVRVTAKQDKSLAKFCDNMKSARRRTRKGTVINDDRIKALDELGFDWGQQKTTLQMLN